VKLAFLPLHETFSSSKFLGYFLQRFLQCSRSAAFDRPNKNDRIKIRFPEKKRKGAFYLLATIPKAVPRSLARAREFQITISSRRRTPRGRIV